MKSLKQLLEDLGYSAEQVDEDFTIVGPAKLSDATDKHLAFLANMRYEEELYTTQARAILVPKDFVPRKAVASILIPVDDPYQVITAILEAFDEEDERTGFDPLSQIHEDAEIGKQVFVGAFSVIREGVKIGAKTSIHSQVYVGKNVEIGKSCIIYPGVKIYHNTVIGDNCIIHSNAVIGSDGFGFAPGEDGHYRKIPQIGNVVLKDKVEVGSNTTIDRATMGSTLIGLGVKLDNLIQIGHNAVIGNHTVIAAQSGVSGSTKVGKRSQIGGQVGIAGHLVIAPGSRINAKSGVSKSVKEKDQKLNGIPAFNFRDSLRSSAVYRRLPELEKKIAEIEEILSLLRK